MALSLPGFCIYKKAHKFIASELWNCESQHHMVFTSVFRN